MSGSALHQALGWNTTAQLQSEYNIYFIDTEREEH